MRRWAWVLAWVAGLVLAAGNAGAQWGRQGQGQGQGQWHSQGQGQGGGQWRSQGHGQGQGQWQSQGQGQGQGQWHSQGQWQGRSQWHSQGQWQGQSSSPQGVFGHSWRQHAQPNYSYFSHAPAPIAVAPVIVPRRYYYVPAPVYVAPPVYVVPPVAAAAPMVLPDMNSGYWYFCPDSRAYYPQVLECPSGWLQVAPNTAGPAY